MSVVFSRLSGTGFLKKPSPASPPQPVCSELPTSGKHSLAGIKVISGVPLAVVGANGNFLSRVGVEEQQQLQLAPGQTIALGRQEGGSVEYLAEGHVPTRRMPGASQDIPQDPCVSRAHFQLKGTTDGSIIFINAVPKRGGGIRKPKNGSTVLSPIYKPLGRGEEYEIPKGQSARIRLGPSTIIQISALDPREIF